MEKLTLIWEPSSNGHRLSYVRYLATYANARGIPYLIGTTPSTKASTEWIEQELNRHESLEADSLREIVHATKDQTRDGVNLVLPDADKQLVQVLANIFRLRRNSTVTLLIMRPYLSPNLASTSKGLLKFGVILAIHILGSLRGTKVKIFGLANAGKKSSYLTKLSAATMISDPCEFQPELTREELGLSEQSANGSIVLMIGELSHRKHFSDVVQTWISNAPPNATLALVGTFMSDVDRELLADAYGNSTVHIQEGYISNQEFDSWIEVASVVLILHRNPESSGVAIKAAAAGTHILVGGNLTTIAAIKQLTSNVTVCEEVTPQNLAHLMHQVLIQPSVKTAPVAKLMNPHEWSAHLLRIE